ncbi:MAG: GTP-binding protein, partial [Oscillospiraceae bacterium]|nr:GTP-binding protein [Oscillospiraceae bacterium]
ECHCHDHDHEHHHHHHEDGEECHCHDHDHEHHHHHHEDGEECHCHDHDHEHHHHHHEDGEECHCHDHDHEHHHHHHDGECCCGHDHHHHHHADEVFVSCGTETTAKFDRAAMADKLNALCDEGKYGIVLRAKGIVAATDGESWIHFDYVPGEPDVREGGAAVIGRLCVIGSNLNIPALSELFGVELA